ncbi:MAG: DUF2752 domain-containing protein [Pyrinomonadaceae bacterium]
MSALADHFIEHGAGNGNRLGVWLNRPGVVPGLGGAALATALVGSRAVAAADLNSVTVAGHVLPWGCWFRQRFGVPCPLCGMTRSVLLTLHGQLTPALQLNPAGPMLVLGLALLSCALVGLLLCAQLPSARGAGERLRQRIQLSATVYAGLFVVVALTHWLLALRAH